MRRSIESWDAIARSLLLFALGWSGGFAFLLFFRSGGGSSSLAFLLLFSGGWSSGFAFLLLGWGSRSATWCGHTCVPTH